MTLPRKIKKSFIREGDICNSKTLKHELRIVKKIKKRYLKYSQKSESASYFSAKFGRNVEVNSLQASVSGFPRCSVVKDPPANAGDIGSIPDPR